jgi:hypothetical protein
MSRLHDAWFATPAVASAVEIRGGAVRVLLTVRPHGAPRRVARAGAGVVLAASTSTARTGPATTMRCGDRFSTAAACPPTPDACGPR